MRKRAFGSAAGAAGAAPRQTRTGGTQQPAHHGADVADRGLQLVQEWLVQDVLAGFACEHVRL